MPAPRRPIPPLDAPALDRLALRYVERFSTTRGRLTQYLTRKLRERGWADATPADPAGVAERMAALNYIDDAAYGEARAAALGRRGLGARRVTQALRHAGIGEEDAATLRPAIDNRATDSALTYARRRRIGPWAAEAPDRAGAQKALAAMLRAGHDFTLARAIIAMAPGEAPENLPEMGQR